MKKTLITILATVLVCCCVVGGTLAYLMATTQTIKNTFTVGNVSITLVETEGTGDANNKSFKMVPGNTIKKDPKVTVVAGSEDCYVFVKIEESNNLNDFITYAVADGWNVLKNGDATIQGVYYRSYNDDDGAQEYPVLTSNEVTVKDTVTKTMVDGLTAETYPTLSFTAYAIQSANTGSAYDAWLKVSA